MWLGSVPPGSLTNKTAESDMYQISTCPLVLRHKMSP